MPSRQRLPSFSLAPGRRNASLGRSTLPASPHRGERPLGGERCPPRRAAILKRETPLPAASDFNPAPTLAMTVKTPPRSARFSPVSLRSFPASCADRRRCRPGENRYEPPPRRIHAREKNQRPLRGRKGDGGGLKARPRDGASGDRPLKPQGIQRACEPPCQRATAALPSDAFGSVFRRIFQETRIRTPRGEKSGDLTQADTCPSRYFFIF